MKNPSVDYVSSRLLGDAGFKNAFSVIPADFGPRASAAQRSETVKALAAAVGFSASDLRQVEQVHGARAVRASSLPSSGDEPRHEADAIYACGDDGPFALGVRTADCVPILVGDLKTGSVAAIHAGWRGLVAGVIPATLTALTEVGSVGRGDIVAAIFPCIGPCCFEVGTDVARQIVGQSSPKRMVSQRGDKAYVDLRGAVRDQLMQYGLLPARVEDVPGCTMCDDDRFFSFRRDAEDSGRHLAVVVRRSR